MEVILHKRFLKKFKKLPVKLQDQFYERVSLLLVDESSHLLRLHELSGDMKPLWSMNVTGEYRALFIREKNVITFYKIGTHSELYS